MTNCDSSSDTCTGNGCVQLNSNFTIEEILKFVSKFPNGRSGGVDGISNEMLKNCSRFLATYLVSVFNGILDSGQFPVEWCKGITVLLFKKSVRNDVSNY